MKFYLAPLIAIPLFITACKKDHDDNKFNPNKDYGCMERIYINKNDHIINSADVAAANKLFADNNIDNSNFRYTRYQSDSVVQVGVEEYAMGLPILNSNAVFYFSNGLYSYDTRRPIDITGLDTIPHTRLPYLKWLFLQDVHTEGGAIGPAANYVDSCLYGELGFYNLNSDGNTPGKAVKAWLVRGKNFYPVGVYNDDDGSRIFYSKGISLY